MATGRQTWQLLRCGATNNVGVGHVAPDAIVDPGRRRCAGEMRRLALWSMLGIASSVAGFAGWCNALEVCGSRGVRGWLLGRGGR
jgi:hypothetical protein